MTEKINNLVLCGFVMMTLICCSGCRSAGVIDTSTQQTLDAYDWQSTVGDQCGIWVSIEHQELLLIENHRVVKNYACSTSKAGAGNVVDSGKTPTGWHRIGAKVGDDLPAGAVLKDRQWTGRLWNADELTEDDLILSRILWLEGFEDGKNRGGNVDTWSRYIYIHGTNRLKNLGRPASAGCIRLDPAQVIDLYNRVDEGCCVLITKE